ncbi:MAG: DUF6760 family protein [Cyanobacteria bacterium P01_G01_bin.54]
MYQEVAYLAMHFHWSRAEILALEHQERRQWVSEINQLLE